MPSGAPSWSTIATTRSAPSRTRSIQIRRHCSPFRENAFATTAVRVQEERGQRVISTGPYAWVRHPLYAGALLYFVGTPLLLGSWFGLVCSIVPMVGLGIRAVVEERVLRAGLPGYDRYMTRVRYRFVPHVW